MPTAPVTRMDSYKVEQIDKQRINRIIAGLDPEKVFLFCLKHFADQNDELAEDISVETLKDALKETYKKLSYALFYQLEQIGEPLTMAALLLLSTHLSGIYAFQISEAPRFTEICDWDMQVALTFETLSNFQSPSRKLAGSEYIEAEALESTVLAESDEVAQVRIEGIIDQVRIRFFQTLVDPSRQELFEGISGVLVSQFIEYRNAFRSPEEIISNIIDEITEFLDESYEEVADILEAEQLIRRIVPEKLARYSQLLEFNCLGIVKALKESFEKNALPDLHSIWNVIITICLESLEGSAEETEADLLRLPALAPDKKNFLSN